jgi:hypothetical protein
MIGRIVSADLLFNLCSVVRRKGTSSSLFNAAFGPQGRDPHDIDIQTVIDRLTQDFQEDGGDVANYPNVRIASRLLVLKIKL